MLEQYWLKDTEYLCGDQMTIADLSAACELYQLLKLEKPLFKQYPLVTDWLLKIYNIKEVGEMHEEVLIKMKQIFKDNE